MHRRLNALVAFVLSAAFTTSAHAQEPAKSVDPKEFWWNDAPPPRAIPPPIIPERWLVVQKMSNASVAQVFARHLLDPKSPAPAVGMDDLTWNSADSSHVAGSAAAFTRITSEHDEVRMARLSGAELLFVNGDGFVGDVGSRGFRGVPVVLKQGDNDLYVLGATNSFDLELWCPQSRAVLGSWDVAWPGESGEGDEMSYPVFNASTQPAEYVHVHYANAYKTGTSHTLGTCEWNDGWRILPLGVRVADNYFGFYSMNEWSPRTEEDAADVPLCVYAEGDPIPDQELLHCAPASERRKARASGLPLRNASAFLGSPLSGFSTDSVFVIPSSESPARARFDQELCWYRARFTPETISAEDLVNADPGRGKLKKWTADRPWSMQNLVLFGNAETNPAWSRLVPDDSPIQVHEGHLSVDGKHYASDDICGWFLFTAKSGKHIVVAASTGAKGARLGYLVQPLFAKSAGLDYCFWDSRGDNGAPRVIASGKFAKQDPDASGR